MSKGYSGLFQGTRGAAPVNGKNYNLARSSSVKQVNSIVMTKNKHSIPVQGTPNSVSRNYRDGKLNSERYYGKDGKAYLDIDYTNHGNPKTHPHVPHEHSIQFDSDGHMKRKRERSIQK